MSPFWIENVGCLICVIQVKHNLMWQDIKSFYIFDVLGIQKNEFVPILN